METEKKPEEHDSKQPAAQSHHNPSQQTPTPRSTSYLPTPGLPINAGKEPVFPKPDHNKAVKAVHDHNTKVIAMAAVAITFIVAFAIGAILAYSNLD